MPGRFLRKAKKPDAIPAPGELGAAGQLPHESLANQLDAPNPQASADLAAGGKSVVRGNSNQQPMTPQGHARIAKVGQELAAKGGATQILPSAAMRTQQTAQDLSAAGAGPVGPPDPGLESHAMGSLEGQPKTPEVKARLREMIRNGEQKIPGQGALSSRPGESATEFYARAGKSVLGLMQKLAQNPSARLVVPTSTQVIKFVRAWGAMGMPDDFKVSAEEMLKDAPPKPGSMERLFPDAQGKWEVTAFDPASASWPPGIYFLDHGETPSVANPNPTAGQTARAQIVKSVMTKDWKGAQKTARAAAAAGHMSHDDIGQAIDEGLPSPRDAADLLPHDLLAVASAASSAKRQQYLPILRQRFAGVSDPSLKSHLGRLGI